MPPPSPETTDLESADPFGPAKTLSPVEQVAALTVGLPADDLESADPFGPAEDPLTPVEQVAASTVGLDLRERDPVEEAEEAEEVRRLLATDLESADPFGPAKTTDPESADPFGPAETTDLESADPFGRAGPRKPPTSAERADFLKNYLAYGAYTGRAVSLWHDTGVAKKRYDPVADSWSMTSWVRKTIQLPTSRFVHEKDRPEPGEGFSITPNEMIPVTDEERADLKAMWEKGEIPDRVYWNEIQRIDRDEPEYQGLGLGQLALIKADEKEKLEKEAAGLTYDPGEVHPKTGKLAATAPTSTYHPFMLSGADFPGGPQAMVAAHHYATTHNKKPYSIETFSEFGPFNEQEAYKYVSNAAGLVEFLLKIGSKDMGQENRMGSWFDPHRTGKAGWIYNAGRFVDETLKDSPIDAYLAVRDSYRGGKYDEYFEGAAIDPDDPNYKMGLDDLEREIGKLEGVEIKAPEQVERLASLESQYAELKEWRDAKLRSNKRWKKVTDRMEAVIVGFNAEARVRSPESESDIGDVSNTFFKNLAKDTGALVSIVPHLTGMAAQIYEWIGDPRHASDKWTTAAANVSSFGIGVGYHFYTYGNDPTIENEAFTTAAYRKFIREPLFVALDISLAGSFLKNTLMAGGKMTATSATRTALDAVLPSTLRKWGRELVDEHTRITQSLLIEYEAGRINGSSLEALVNASAVETKNAVLVRMEEMVKNGTLSRAEFNSATAKLGGEMAGITPFEVIVEKAPEAAIARRLAEMEEALPSTEAALSSAEDLAKLSAEELVLATEKAGDLASHTRAAAYMDDIQKAGHQIDDTHMLYGEGSLELTKKITGPKVIYAFQTALDIIDPSAGIRMVSGMTGTEMLGILKERISKGPPARVPSGGLIIDRRAPSKGWVTPKRPPAVLETELARKGRWGEVVKTARLGVEAAQAELKTALGLKDKAAIKTARTRLKKAKSDLRAANKRGAKAATGAQQIGAGYSTLEKLLKDIGLERVVLNGKKIGKTGPTTKQLKKAQRIADDLEGIRRTGDKYPPRVQAYMDRVAADTAAHRAVQAARRDVAQLHSELAAANAGVRMRSRVGVAKDLPGASKSAAVWSIRFNKAAAFIDKHWGKINPLWGVPKAMNWLIGNALKGERPGNALWRYWYHTQDSRLLEAVTVLRREATGASDAFQIALSNRLRQVTAEIGDDAAALIFLHDMLKFEREHVISKFNRNPEARYAGGVPGTELGAVAPRLLAGPRLPSMNSMYPYGQRFTLKEGVPLTPEIQRQLNVANKYSDLIDYAKYITQRGEEVGAFWGKEGLLEVYYPEVYKDMAGKIELLTGEAEAAVYTAALKRNTRRARLKEEFKEIEAREADGLISREGALAEKTAASEASLDAAEKGYAIRGKTGEKEGRRRLSTDFNESLMERYPQTIKEFEEINMYTEMQKNPAVVKAFGTIDTGTAGVPKALWDTLRQEERVALLEKFNQSIKKTWAERGWIEIGPDVGKMVKVPFGHKLYSAADPKRMVPKIKLTFPDAVKGSARTPGEVFGRAAGDGWWIPGKRAVSPRKLVAIENSHAPHLVKQRLGKYGPMNGMLQADVAYDMLYSAHFMKAMKGWWATGLGAWKAGKTILATGTHATNFLSNMLVMGPAAGLSVANPLNWKYLHQAGKEFALGERGVMYVRWVKAGGKGPSGVINRSEIVRATEKGIGIHYSGALGKSQKMWHDVTGILRDPAKDFTNATFALSEDLASGSLGRIAKAFPGRAARIIMDYPGYAYQAGDDFWRFALFLKKVAGGADDLAAAKAGLKGFADYGALAGWANLTRVSWWGKPFLAFDASMIPQMLKFFEKSPWQASWWMHVTEQMSRQNMMSAGIDPEQLDAWLQGQPPWRRSLLLLGELNPDWAFDDEGRLRTIAMMKYTPFQRLLKRPEESMARFLLRSAATENPVLSGMAYGMWDYDPYKQQQLFDEDATDEQKAKARGQAWGQLAFPSTPFPIKVLALENYASKRKGMSLDQKRLELLNGEFEELLAIGSPTAEDQERMDHLSEEIFEMQRRSRPRPGMLRAETPGEALAGYAGGINAPTVGKEDVRRATAAQVKWKLSGIKHRIYLLRKELRQITIKTPALDHYKKMRKEVLKLELGALEAKRDKLKKAQEVYDSQMVEAMWSPPEKPQASRKEMEAVIESELGKQYGE